MSIHWRNSGGFGLLAGLAVLALSPERASPKPDTGAQQGAEAAAAQEAPPSDQAPDAPGDQAATDPDCPDGGLATADDARHLIDDPYGHAFTGAANGKVKLVVFADYGCPACREAQPVLDRLVAENPQLEVVYRIVDNEPDSGGVSGVSIQVARSHVDWQAFHHALDAGDSVSDEAIGKALEAVHLKKECFLPSDKVQADPLVSGELQRNRQFLFERKLQGFPSWVIGKGPVHEGIDYATLKAAIAKAR